MYISGSGNEYDGHGTLKCYTRERGHLVPQSSSSLGILSIHIHIVHIHLLQQYLLSDDLIIFQENLC